jgi:peptidoglycan/xylan/chitin deacetylase (PgdA/CDA1 family)
VPAIERDLAGYGKTPPVVKWPDGARIAVSFVVNYEEGSEETPYFGDKTHQRAGEIASGRPDHERDLQTETQWEYGARAGIWRLYRVFEKQAVKITVFACGMALEQNPEVGAEAGRLGHDVCGHGYRWIPQWQCEREEERTLIRKTVDAIRTTSGKRPLGWFTRSGPSSNTRELLAEEGFLYDCDGLNDDLPYYFSTAGKPFLIVPYAFDSNDGKYWHNGWHGRDFYEYLRASFDMLYEEGKTHPRMLSIGLHSRVSGRPGRALAVEQFVQYVKSQSKVWIAGRDDIARWWLEHYPAA